MKTYLDCIACGVRQALEAARRVSDDPEFHERILRETLEKLARMDYCLPPPAIARDIHRLTRSLSGVEDPFFEDKRRFNNYVLDRLDHYKSMVSSSPDPFETALRLALAGNVIDLGVRSEIEESEVESTVSQALEAELDREAVEDFRKTLQNARNVLYVADNAGEIVFDRLLIETILDRQGAPEICLLVRGQPILNDVTAEDASLVGIDKICRVVDNGTDSPGTILEDCSPECLAEFERAELVISKGQGNYETLSELEQDTFFLLKVKCPVIARDIGSELGRFLVLRNRR
ncbi:MAG: ARMT1-like domain-containing protein [Gemmatimonadota bacterium]|nr:ARMT1-like domain-containing protein [Gemmatimonadota bacterium]